MGTGGQSLLGRGEALHLCGGVLGQVSQSNNEKIVLNLYLEYNFDNKFRRFISPLVQSITAVIRLQIVNLYCMINFLSSALGQAQRR